MNPKTIPEELIRHLSESAALSPADAERLALEVVHYYSGTVQDFIITRHQELQRSGLSNKAIFRLIEMEISDRLFTTDPVTERQIRRTIYG